MRSIISHRRMSFCLMLLIIYLLLITYTHFPHTTSPIRQKLVALHHLQSKSIDHQLCTTPLYSNISHIDTIIWTHHGTGIMKYIQWIITRKLLNIRITELDDHCCIIKETSFSSLRTLLQIYIVSLSADLTQSSSCSIKISQTAAMSNDTTSRHVKHIYFRRKSLAATVVFDQLDLLRQKHDASSTSNISYFHARIEQVKDIVERFPHYFTTLPSTKWKIAMEEDLVHPNLTDCERSLTKFLSLLGVDSSSKTVKSIIEYDSHRFIEDAVWWDRSDVAQRILSRSLPLRPLTLTYSNDFYHLHGSRSFVQYLSDNRQCYTDGTFAQMQSETMPNRRPSGNEEDRCLSNAFDCAFSDIYSFNDRKQLYEAYESETYFNVKPVKCGFAIASIFDKVRSRYGRNETCETIILTSIINCYDPLPGVDGDTPPSFCFVALLDTQTHEALRGRFQAGAAARWDLIDLGANASLFSFPAKTVETLKTAGQRLFPLAKWIIWLDGKALLMNPILVLIEAQAATFAARHTEVDRTSAIEVNYTIERIRLREKPFSESLNKSVMDIKRQEAEYKRDGFYARSDALSIRMYDIALFLYRNNHPCNFRYLCGWHNEINYFSYRGQLSVYYSAVRLNITHHFNILPRKYYHTFAHGKVCQ